MEIERFMQELYLCLNYDRNFPADSIVVEENEIEIELKDGSLFAVKVEEKKK